MEISQQRAETPEAQRYIEKLHEGVFWDLDFCYFGSDNLFLPSSYSKWSSYIRQVPVHDDDIWVISFPKCGTTWVTEMVWLLGNNLDFEAARQKFSEERFSFLEIDAFYRIPPKWNGTDETNKPLTSMEELSLSDVNQPRFIKSHLPLSYLPKDLLKKKAKIIYVTRNPKDACVSLYHHNVLMFGYSGTLDDFCEAFLTGNANSCPYWPNVKSFYEVRNHPNVLFLTYEEMKKDLSAVITRTTGFLGKEFTAAQLSQLEHHLSFDQMKANPCANMENHVVAARTVPALADIPIKTTFLRKGKVGSWKEEMSAEWIRKFDSWIAENGIPGLYS